MLSRAEPLAAASIPRAAVVVACRVVRCALREALGHLGVGDTAPSSAVLQSSCGSTIGELLPDVSLEYSVNA
jgi:hypothetical protein